MTNNKKVEQFVKQWIEGHEPETFVKNESGNIIYSAKHSSINLVAFFENMLSDFIEENNQFISVKDAMPEIDNTDDWNVKNKISVRCITYSDYGIRFGQYFGLADKWNIDGVTSSNGIKVTHWQNLPNAPYEL